MKPNTTFQPEWIDYPPPPGSYRSIFKYGSPDAFKHPSKRMIDMLIRDLGLTTREIKHQKNLGLEKIDLEEPVPLSTNQIKEIVKIFGQENVSLSTYDRIKYSYGKTLEEAWQLREKKIEDITGLVVHPKTKDQIARLVSYCNDQKIPVYTFGGGTSVTLGLRPQKPGVTVVLQTHMNKILELNELNQTVRVQAGILGPELEHQLNYAPAYFGTKHSYTCGHFPQSFEYSTAGGWFVTLGSGQDSSYYGDAADHVLAVEVITPRGTINTIDFPAAATGPNLLDIFKGSEGAFGIVTELTWKIHRYMPQNRQYFSFIFPDWHSAVEATREISQGEFGMPSVMRISDPDETKFAFELYGINKPVINRLLALRRIYPGNRSLLIGTANGQKTFARNIKKQVKKIARSYKAINTTGYPAKKWEKGRFSDPYLREDLMDIGIQIDTLETSVRWDNLHQVHSSVKDFIKSRPNTIVMSHSSHFYKNGTNLYFIFITRETDPQKYIEFHRSIIDVIVKNGGSPSHHHGIGRMMAPWLDNYLGREQMDVLRTLKQYFDPNHIMNPGVLGL